MLKNLHIVRSDVTHDTRVLKETGTLAASGLFDAVEIAGFEAPDQDEREYLNGRHIWRVQIKSRSLPKHLASQTLKFFEWRFRLDREYRQHPIAVIHCHDLEPLPIAVKLKRSTGAKLIYDAHELETERAGVRGVRRQLAKATESRYIKWVDAMITVSPSIREWYWQHRRRMPIALVRNIPNRPDDAMAPRNLKKQLSVPSDRLLFIYQGAHTPSRGIETILQAFSCPDVTHHVVFMGSGSLEEKVRTTASKHPNIHWMAPVLPDVVLHTTAGADVGFSLTEDVALSYRYSLPNKLFEYWSAGIPVIVSSLPDQARLVQKYAAGWITRGTYQELVELLKSLTFDDLISTQRGVESARRELSWSNEAKELLRLYRHVLHGVEWEQIVDG